VHYLEQRLKLRHLRVIDALVESKSLLRASEVLGVSQPALTRTLREIEEVVGTEIFERHARGVRANEVGLLLAEGARSLLLILRRMEGDLAALSDTRKWNIRVGVSPISALGLMPAVIARSTTSALQLSINLIEGRTDQLLPALVKGEIDMVVGRLYDQPPPDGLTQHVLYQEPVSLIAAASHPLSQVATLSAANLAAYPMVLPPVGSPLEKEVLEILEALDLIPMQSLNSTSMGLTRELLIDGNFITVMPRILVAGDIVRGTLRLLPVAFPPVIRPAGLVYRNELGVAGNLMLVELSREIARLVDEGILNLPE
jgi:LysR family pca operon transcriptional activator